MRSDFQTSTPFARAALVLKQACHALGLGYLIKNMLRKMGFELRYVGATTSAPTDPKIWHSQVWPFATYSPWLTDTAFKRIYDEIKHHTLVDHYLCYDLWQLVTEAAKLDRGDLIEVGSWRGGTGCVIARRAELSNLTNTVYLCDTFKGVVKAGALDPFYAGGEHADTSPEIVNGLVRRLGLKNVEVLTGVFPEETGHRVAHREFRFCHIDVDVYQSAADVVEWVWPRLIAGGMIVYDDYGFKGCEGVTRFVNEQRLKPDRLILHNLNGHAIAIKQHTSTSSRRRWLHDLRRRSMPGP
jgi:O-methyltransferase